MSGTSNGKRSWLSRRGNNHAARPRARDSVYAGQAPGWKRYWRFLVEVVLATGRDDVAVLAAALAHFTMLSLIPVLLLTASVLGTYLKSERAQEQAIALVNQYIPLLTEESVAVVPPEESPDGDSAVGLVFQSLVRERGTAGGFGLLALLWICLRIFTVLQRALDHIWNIQPHEKRPFYWRYPVALLTVLSVGLFAWLSMVATSLVGSLRLNWVEHLLGYPLPDLLTVSSVIVSLLMSVLLMFLIYRWLPSARVRSRSAVYGAAVAGVLWEIAKHTFAWLVTKKTRIDQVYGAMGSVVILILWSYLSAYILLLGAEVAFCHAKWIAAMPVIEEPAAPEEESA